jgi:hypothetical protein
VKRQFSFIALILMAQSPAAPTLPANDADITVTARRLSNRWSGRVDVLNGENSCKTIRSTGDDEFDAIGCRAMLQCWPEFSRRLALVLKSEVATGRITAREALDTAYSRPPFHKEFVRLGKCVQPQIRSNIRDAIKRRRASQ